MLRNARWHLYIIIFFDTYSGCAYLADLGCKGMVGWPQAIKLRKVSTLLFWTEMVSKPVGSHTMITVSHHHKKSCTTSTYMYQVPSCTYLIYHGLLSHSRVQRSLLTALKKHSPGQSRPYLQGNQGFEALQPHLTTSCWQILCPESPLEEPETKKNTATGLGSKWLNTI